MVGFYCNKLLVITLSETRDLADFAQKLERYDEQVVQLRGNMDANRSIALGSQKRVDRQDEQIAELKRQLEEEAEVRQALTKRVEVVEKSNAKRKKVEEE